ncbi:Endonuclease/exonuclease/phosphatase [Hypoxylon trugodes]|uniref:Endonuclease/exonuclease/phosphatase n=1 Tax=Hypoxylon trugodes TaxID=326681 RepID=UPI0021A189C9|nr:Endonuclease/exonuclease/phosphatase [Hypoxylon trugodes]KAI1384611.1 Endonuclease/exonuclease/phosphatase [Hypoxylon trugodes]
MFRKASKHLSLVRRNLYHPTRTCHFFIMDELIQKAIKETQESVKPMDSVKWKPDEPHPQSYFAYDSDKQAWQPMEASGNTQNESGFGITQLALYSWNVDFMLPLAKERMDIALAHLEGLTSKLPPTTAAVIYLQESIAQDLTTVGEKPWIREKYYVTDIDDSNWAARYGTTTLVDRRLDITNCFRVHYAKTRMQRDAFFVDIVLGGGKTVRLCNTHLESLAFEPPFRPPQMQVVVKYMHDENVFGAVAAGDFNAIQPFDRTLHEDNGLKDAYLELGGKEDSEEGYTWGQQATTTLRERFGCSRMDKVYFAGRVKLLSFERFGRDVELSDPAQRERVVSLGFEKPWITDHLGVVAHFRVEDP